MAIDFFSPVLILPALALICFFCQWLAWRLRLPAILFLLLTGIILGPIGGLLAPNDLLGNLLFPLVSLSVSLILFEGSLTLKFEEVRETGRVVRKLVTIGVLVTWILSSLLCHWLIGLEPGLSALFGSLVVVTGPTVIVPMLRTLRVPPRIGDVLRWEGILVDPLGALLAVLVYEWITAPVHDGTGLTDTAVALFKVIVTGSLAGIAAGSALAAALRRGWLPEYLEVLATMALVLGTFTLSNHFAHESGLLAVTLMGIWLANAPRINIERILIFKEDLTVMLVSGLFILLAARLNLDALIALEWPALVLLALIQFIVRPVSVWMSSLGSQLTWRERTMIAWVGPRGIVAAAVSSLFVLRLEQEGYENAGLISALTFSVIIGTVVFQSATARPMAVLLDVVKPEPRGLLLIGANPVARALAKTLQQLDVLVLLVDTRWVHVQQARMMGLRILHGNPLSASMNTMLDTSGLGYMLAMTPLHEWNTLLSMHFRRDFADNCIFSVRNELEETGEHLEISAQYQGLPLGSEDLTFSKLSNLIALGAQFQTTRLTSELTYEQWQAQSDEDCIPLLALTPDRHLRLITPEMDNIPEEGWTLIYFNTTIRERNGSNPSDRIDR